HALAPLCRRPGVRLVATRRMDYVPAGGPYVRFLYNRAVDAVVAISEGVRDALVRVGVRRERIRVVPSGIDPGAYATPPGSRVACRVRGLPAVVQTDATGHLVPPGDPGALGTALARLAVDGALRARLGAAGRVRVHARFTSAQMAEGTLACYRGEP